MSRLKGSGVPSIERKGQELETGIFAWVAFIPRIYRTYLLVCTQPSRYANLRATDPAAGQVVAPAPFWLANVALAKAITAALASGSRPGVRHGMTDVIGLVLGTVLFVFYLMLCRRDNFRRILRAVFAGSAVFAPLAIVCSVKFAGNAYSDLITPSIYGTRPAVHWQDVALLLTDAILLLVWFAVIAAGIAASFKRSKLSVVLHFFSLTGVLSVGLAIFIAVGILVWARPQLAALYQGVAPIRTALIRTPPDYVAASRGFRSLYSRKFALGVNREARLGARIGEVAAGMANKAVLMRQPEMERAAYEAQMRVLEGKNQEAAQLVLQEAARWKASTPRGRGRRVRQQRAEVLARGNPAHAQRFLV